MYVSRRTILNDVIKALEGSSPSYSFSNVDGFYVATGFVVVPLAGDIDELTLLEATGSASLTKDGAEEAAANAQSWRQSVILVLLSTISVSMMQSI